MNLESYISLAAELGIDRGQLGKRFEPELGSLESLQREAHAKPAFFKLPPPYELEDFSHLPGGATNRQKAAISAYARLKRSNYKAISERNRKNGNGNKKI